MVVVVPIVNVNFVVVVARAFSTYTSIKSGYIYIYFKFSIQIDLQCCPVSVPHNVWPGENEGPTTVNVSEQAPAVLTPK